MLLYLGFKYNATKTKLTCLNVSSGQFSWGTEVDTDELTLDKKESKY